MNNYLAKPVRAQTLQALLESYLNKNNESPEIPNLAKEAKKMVKEALKEAQALPNVTGGNEKMNKEAGIEKAAVGVKKDLDGESTGLKGKKEPDAESKAVDAKTDRPPGVRMSTTQHILPNGKTEPVPPPG
jgi:YesN/AraC family two-component response regulator